MCHLHRKAPIGRFNRLTFFNIFAGLNRILRDFTGFDWVLPSFTGFDWIISETLKVCNLYRRLSIVACFIFGFSVFFDILADFSGFYQVLSGFVGFCRLEEGFYRVLTRFYRVSLGFIDLRKVLPGFSRFYRVSLGFIDF